MSKGLTPQEFWSLMDDYAKAFGWIAMHWSHLERNMCILLQRLAGTSRTTAEAIYLPLNADSRKKLLASLVLANISDEPLRTRLLDFLDRFDAARVRRNNYMHSSVAWVDPQDQIMRQHRESQRGKLKKDVAEVPLAEVQLFRDELNRLGNEVLADFCFHADFAEAFAEISKSAVSPANKP
jgi:hypothetical protein